jgi:hypothetical protein
MPGPNAKLIARMLAWQEKSRFATIREPYSVTRHRIAIRSSAMKLASNMGMMLLGIFLILYGIIPLLNLNQVPPAVLQGLAIAAGVLLLMNK